MQLEEILRLAIKKGASDVHLKAGVPPVIRKHGILRPLTANSTKLSIQEVELIARSIMTEEQFRILNTRKELDLSYGIQGLGRFRISICRQLSNLRIVIRNIPEVAPSITQLQLPDIVHKIADYERGLVLVTGATGSGKSSTLAGIIDQINRTKNKHILTIEDPIEFLIKDRRALITQRELGSDANSFAEALRAGLRQDPDVILIGEMRDLETIQIALLAAETGHLVLSTLHTLDAQETVNRIVASFPAGQQQQIRLQLGATLRAVLSQRLARRKDKTGFIPVVEVLINNTRIREMIEAPNKTKEITLAISESKSSFGMQTFDQALMDLLTQEVITYDEALRLASLPEDFKIRYAGITPMDEKKWEGRAKHGKKLADEWEQITEVQMEKQGEISEETVTALTKTKTRY